MRVQEARAAIVRELGNVRREGVTEDGQRYKAGDEVTYWNGDVRDRETVAAVREDGWVELESGDTFEASAIVDVLR